MLENLKESALKKLNQIRGIEEEPEEEPIPEFKLDQNMGKCYVLLIDKKGEDLIELKQLCDRLGCITTVSHTGMACMERVLKDKYDIICIAKDLPLMDGAQTMRNIRSTKESKCRDAKIYALVPPEDKTPEDELIKAGFKGMLRMPVDEALFCKILMENVSSKMLPEDPRLIALIEERAAAAKALQPCGVSLSEGLKANGGDMNELKIQMGKFCDLYEEYRGKLSLYVFGNDVDAYMTGAREVREAAKMIGARYLADIFDDHVNLSKDDSLDVAAATWGRTLLAWERVVSGVAIYLGRSIELVATVTERMKTNGIRLHWADIQAIAKGILDLVNDSEMEDAVASMDRLLTYEMSGTSRLKLVKASRALNRGDVDEAREALSIILSN
ncbi:MAG: hypothetical protein IJM25_00960 [Eubacterium sp.]|nr:hypothetical protein [Eubacterium sp.]